MKTFFKIFTLVLCLGVLALLTMARVEQAESVSAPADSAEPSAISVSVIESLAPTATAAATAEPTPDPTPTPAPEPETYTLSFVGDCTLWSNTMYAQHSAGYAKTINGDYSYPFANTVQYFSDDDCTFANLECVLSDEQLTLDYTNSLFYFLAPTEYTNILLEGGVDFVTTANNHIKDYYEAGAESTYAALEEYGLAYGTECQSQIIETESGLKIGVYTAGTDMRPDWKTDTAVEAIQSLREQGAEFIICMFHWGKEGYYEVFDYQTSLAHACIDAGADLIYGSHPHYLQPIEEYNGKLILYSVGNWTFGGNTNPSDPDTAIVQVTLTREEDGSLSRDGYTVIPCCVSSKIDEAQSGTQNYNDYKPTPYEEGTEEYYRVLAKLDGTFEYTSQGVDYSDYYASLG